MRNLILAAAIAMTGLSQILSAAPTAYVINTSGETLSKIDLPPGAYMVTLKIEGRFPAGTPTAVTVLSGQYVEVNVELDSGMR